jgi:hypothetical protein
MTTNTDIQRTNGSTPTERTGPPRSVPLVGDEPAMREWAAELVDRARHDGVELTGDNGLLTALVRQVLQTGLEVEMTDHLGYDRHAVEGRGTGNSRNGSYPKTVTTEVGQVELQVPRDRNATFEPATVPKGQRRLDGLSGNVISLYAKGMTTGDIRAHLAEIYDTSISADTISRITDAVLDDMQIWQQRPLDRVYPVILIDAIVVKIRDGQVANRPIYVAMGINLDGERDVLGLWVGPTGGDGGQVLGQRVGRVAQPRHPRHVHRVLRRSQRAPGCDPSDVAARRCAAVRRAPGALGNQVHVDEVLGPGVPGDARDLHRTIIGGRRGSLCRVRRHVAGQVSGDDRDLGVGVERLRAVLGLPDRAPPARLHDEFDREPQLEVPQSRPAPRSFPDRASCVESALPDSDREEEEPFEPDRPDQRLEADPEHLDHPLRRPHPGRQLTMTITPGYTSDRILPLG